MVSPLRSNTILGNIQMTTIKPYSFSLYLLPENIYCDPNLLTIYNPMTQLNDNYVRAKRDNYNIINSKSFSYYNHNGIRMDSLNPYGSSTIGEALLNGVLGTMGMDLFIDSAYPSR